MLREDVLILSIYLTLPHPNRIPTRMRVSTGPLQLLVYGQPWLFEINLTEDGGKNWVDRVTSTRV